MPMKMIWKFSMVFIIAFSTVIQAGEPDEAEEVGIEVVRFEMGPYEGRGRYRVFLHLETMPPHTSGVLVEGLLQVMILSEDPDPDRSSKPRVTSFHGVLLRAEEPKTVGVSLMLGRWFEPGEQFRISAKVCPVNPVHPVKISAPDWKVFDCRFLLCPR